MTTRHESDASATPLWYKDAVIYELHVRAFADSNSDGIGDFQGLIGKLDYLQSLGVTAIWLLPFFPSPLRDDGYDISDYTAVHPAYGTLADFKAFLDEAHQRGLRVIIELVLNHTSDQHPWFQRARNAPPGSSERDFYVWSDSPDRYSDARVIFQDYEQSNWTWDSVAHAYFWHRFYSHQPDLNYDHPPVRQAIFETVDFWLEMGVDGLRLDAVPYLSEQEGTSSENLPETHRFLKALRAHVDEHFSGRMLLAEANQWPEDAVAYFGDGDECHMAFQFPLMPRLFMALRTEDRLPLQDIMAQTPPIPENCQWALFLRNHDELTLEMVTDEERLYMYDAFAPAEEARVNLGIRRRLAPLLGNSRRRIELMNALLCSLPGTPVIYYGDEIGMGDNIYLGDRDGVRTPMQWSADRNAGFSGASPQRLYLPLIVDYEYHHEAVHVEAQESNASSMLAYMKRVLDLRKRSRAFGRGTLQMLNPSNHRVLAFIREYEDECILVVANLSRFSQAVELDLSQYKGATPIEMFGRIAFWEIDDSPYPLTMGPHAFFWFLLAPAAQDPSQTPDRASADQLPVIATSGSWASVLKGKDRHQLERVLPSFLARQLWFRGTADTVLRATVIDVVSSPNGGQPIYVTPVRVTYSDRDPESYLLALRCVSLGEDDTSMRFTSPVARIQSRTDGDALLVDILEEETIHDAVQWIANESDEPLRGAVGEIAIERTNDEARITSPSDVPRFTSSMEALGQNPVFHSERMVIKLLRRTNEGINPEWEIGTALTEQGFANIPAVLGGVEYRRPDHRPMTIAVLQSHVPNAGHAWDYTAAYLDQYVENTLTPGIVVSKPDVLTATDLLAATDDSPPEAIADHLAPWLSFARRLGQRTAELHRALAGMPTRPDFAPESFTGYDQRSLYQSMRGLTARTLRSIHHALPDLDVEGRRLADEILEREEQLYGRFRSILDQPASGRRIRCHGDFHLGQVLLTDDDVVFVDFEGEPDRFLEERRLKAPPLRDVATMLHSFQLAATHAIATHRVEHEASAEQRSALDALLWSWCRYGSAAFLEHYQREANEDGLLPSTQEARAALIDLLLLERTVYEVRYRLVHEPDQAVLPLDRLRHVLDNS